MRYCPACKTDYDEDVFECASCGGPLVEGSARDAFEEVDEDSWVELDPLSSLAHAKLVLEALEEEEIPCYIEAYYSGSGLESFAANILVPDSVYEHALEIQQGMAPPADDDLLLDPDADDY
ncbi:MAG TPA: hypothetical protein ENI92_00290 [Bacteroidetes bacterium]|nr:hypothetical protein [Bacteroidota bacterium]